MNIKTPNQSTAEALNYIVKSVLPQMTNTGLSRHCHHITNDPKSKGKAIIFKWNKSLFRLTENLAVTEISFYNEWEKTEETSKVENDIKNFATKMYAVVKTEVAA